MRDRERLYGISADEQIDLFERQGACCANPGCRAPLNFRECHLDHDHKTGRVRGFLCSECNRALGLLGDALRRILGLAEYIQCWQSNSTSTALTSFSAPVEVDQAKGTDGHRPADP